MINNLGQVAFQPRRPEVEGSSIGPVEIVDLDSGSRCSLGPAAYDVRAMNGVGQVVGSYDDQAVLWNVPGA